MSLAATKRPLPGFTRHLSDDCRRNRLKPEQQTAALRLQYVRTKILCRSAAPAYEINRESVTADPRGDELRMLL
jgi:hypothetical protein